MYIIVLCSFEEGDFIEWPDLGKPVILAPICILKNYNNNAGIVASLCDYMVKKDL